MATLDDKEKLFLDFYIAHSLKPSTRIECYKMAFTDHAEELKDSTIETYAKTILAKQEAKCYIEERKVSNSTSTFQLMEAIRMLDSMLKEKQKPVDRIHILRERRMTIKELSELIEVVKPSSTVEDKYLISDGSLTLDAGISLDSIKKDPEMAVAALITAGPGTIVVVDRDGTIRNVTVMSKQHARRFRNEISKGRFRIAVERETDDQ